MNGFCQPSSKEPARADWLAGVSTSVGAERHLAMAVAKRSILIVDDDALNLEILEEVLGDRFLVRRASSGEEALAAVRAAPPDLILLDIVMPGIGGYETCRRITCDPRNARTKVILLSGRGKKEERMQGYQVGASDFVVKPFDADELLAKVDVFLALKSAQEESLAKSSFLANMSHEIRTPMTAILGYAETLRDPALAEADKRTAIDTIWRNGQHLLELINNILDLTKIEANSTAIEALPCSPGDVVAEVVALMQVRAAPAGLSLGIEYDGPIPALIHTDPTRLRQILINLVGNALKFTERGGVRLVLRLQATAPAGPELEIDVVDTGIGIAPEQLESLCEPFVQADASVTRRFGGTGLGLSISKRLATMLGGGLEIRSAPGEGSTFRVRVATGSLAGVALHASPADAKPPRARAKARRTAVPQVAGRILLAEDGVDNQRLLSFVLQKAGAQVVVVENGERAIAAALAAQGEGRPFDVILMDMQMPVLDGYAATAQLRASGYTGAIVAVTAHAMVGDRERCLAAGCDRFATKPVDREELLQTIHELLHA